MAGTLYLSIPCTFEDKVLTIKALSLRGKGDGPDQALLDCIKNTDLYTPLLLSKFKSFTDFRGRSFRTLEVPYSSILLETISQVEPTPEDKKKIRKSKYLYDSTPEEILTLGY